MRITSMRVSKSIWSTLKTTRLVPRTVKQAHFCSSTSGNTPPFTSLHLAPLGQSYSPKRFRSDKTTQYDRKEDIEFSEGRAGQAKDAVRQTKDDGKREFHHESASPHMHENTPDVTTKKSAGRGPGSHEAHGSLPSQPSTQDSNLRHQFTRFMDNFQSTLFTASQRLNDLTGYSGIESLKKDIEAQEAELQESRIAVKHKRQLYSETITTRSTTQREVNDLLQRKNSWSQSDLERFTNLYRSDHANEQAEAAAQKDISDAETRYEEVSTRLNRTILARYHEEQIWSDKIRQMSTWGTWGLMGLNVVLFLLFQIAIEPWRRRRLVNGFEEKVEQAFKERDEHSRTGSPQPITTAALLRSDQKGAEVAEGITEQVVDVATGAKASSATAAAATSDIEEAIETVTSSETEHEETVSEFPTASQKFSTNVSGYAYYEEAFQELFSDRQIVVTQKDMTTVALESAIGGAALMGLLLVLLRPR